MYAVIKTGGKQYRVEKNEVVAVELLDAKEGDTVTFDQVLLLGGDGTAKIGTPTVAGASVKATVLEQKKTDKVIVFKKKRRQNYRRKQGHRQNMTIVRITAIA
jgi:large subunit ribosomal protein L21